MVGQLNQKERIPGSHVNGPANPLFALVGDSRSHAMRENGPGFLLVQAVDFDDCDAGPLAKKPEVRPEWPHSEQEPKLMRVSRSNRI
jgi:hypothetical protein